MMDQLVVVGDELALLSLTIAAWCGDCDWRWSLGSDEHNLGGKLLLKLRLDEEAFSGDGLGRVIEREDPVQADRRRVKRVLSLAFKLLFSLSRLENR